MDSDACHWVDVRSAVAVTGITLEQLASAMARGDVVFDTHRPGHLQVPMLLLEDVQDLAGQV